MSISIFSAKVNALRFDFFFPENINPADNYAAFQNATSSLFSFAYLIEDICA